MSGDDATWLDEVEPFEPEDSRQQIDALLDLLDTPPRRVLDLGCGVGRTLVPLAVAGHEVTGLDRDPGRLQSCRDALRDAGVDAGLREIDFLSQWPGDLGSFDVACCLGNTMMTIVDVADAVTMLRHVVASLRPGGMFVMDDCPQRCWPELTEGNWQSGLSEDGRWQMVWAPDDAVFTVREDSQVDPESWVPRDGDRLFRMWTTGALSLAASSAGLSGAGMRTGEGLLIMRQADG